MSIPTKIHRAAARPSRVPPTQQVPAAILLAAGLVLAGCRATQAPGTVPVPVVPGANLATPVPANIGTPVPPPGLIATPTGTPTTVAPTVVVTQIKGRVTDANGDPVVDVSLAVVESPMPMPQIAVFTDANGEYTWYVKPGTFTLEAYRDGYVTQRQEVTVAEGQTATADFRLEVP
jgi:hypothetical protein